MRHNLPLYNPFHALTLICFSASMIIAPAGYAAIYRYVNINMSSWNKWAIYNSDFAKSRINWCWESVILLEIKENLRIWLQWSSTCSIGSWKHSVPSWCSSKLTSTSPSSTYLSCLLELPLYISWGLKKIERLQKNISTSFLSLSKNHHQFHLLKMCLLHKATKG